ncbi:hypothetical protein [Streptomyces tubercidicus]
MAKKVNSAVFPGQRGGPLEHVIAATLRARVATLADAHPLLYPEL